MFRDIILWLAGVPIFVIIPASIRRQAEVTTVSVAPCSVRGFGPMARADKSLVSLHLLHRAANGPMACLPATPNGELTPRQFATLQAVVDQRSQPDRHHGYDRIDRPRPPILHDDWSNRCLQRRRTRRDARSYAVRVTPLGRLMRGIGAKATRAAEDELLGSIPIHQRAEFVQLLMRIAVSREE
jgi:hypothetical protein